MRLNFCYLKIIRFLHPRYHPKIIGNIIKNAPKKHVCLFKGMLGNRKLCRKAFLNSKLRKKLVSLLIAYRT